MGDGGKEGTKKTNVGRGFNLETNWPSQDEILSLLTNIVSIHPCIPLASFVCEVYGSTCSPVCKAMAENTDC